MRRKNTKPEKVEWPLQRVQKGQHIFRAHSPLFALGKYMIAWTRYGGVCFDTGNPDDSKVQPINAGDIVLGAGGSRRYAIVARYNEVSKLVLNQA